MLLCCIIDELKPTTEGSVLSYFLCQGTDSRINNAAAVLRGLISLLVEQQQSLIAHVRGKYYHVGKQLFEGKDTWVALSEILRDILQDSSLKNTYLMVDALGECDPNERKTDLPRLWT